MAFNFALPLRAFQFFFAIIVLGLSGYVAHWYDSYSLQSSPSQVNFLIFVSLWTMLAVPYLALSTLYFPRISHKFATVAIDALTMLFWFAGFIALAVFVSNLILCLGHVCGAAKAAAVFGAFEWLLFVATTVLAAIHVFRTRNSSNTKPAANTGVQV